MADGAIVFGEGHRILGVRVAVLSSFWIKTGELNMRERTATAD
ncbi:hypothetical protein ACTJI8_17390 [Microbacterium sp. 22303]